MYDLDPYFDEGIGLCLDYAEGIDLTFSDEVLDKLQFSAMFDESATQDSEWNYYGSDDVDF